MISISPQIVALLFGLIPVGDHFLPVHFEFKSMDACKSARGVLEAKHSGAKLSCLGNAVQSVGGTGWAGGSGGDGGLLD